MHNMTCTNVSQCSNLLHLPWNEYHWTLNWNIKLLYIMLLLYYWHISSPVNWYLVMTWYTIQNLQHTRHDQRVSAPTLCQTNSTQLTFSALGISRSYFKFYCFYSFKLFTFQGVPNSGKEEKSTWNHVWGVQGLTRLWNVFSGCITWVHCHLESSMQQTTIFLAVHSWLNHLCTCNKMVVHSLALCSTVIVHNTFK